MASVVTPQKARPAEALVRLLWIFTCLLVLIGIVIVIRRAVQLIAPAPPSPAFPEGAMLDAGFERHPVLTMVHIVPAFFFIVLCPLQFVQYLRNRYPRVHRWWGRTAVACGIVAGVAALVMSPQMAIGGANETAATMLFGVIFLFCLIRAFVLVRRRRFALHREWMIRAFAVGSAVATIRPIMGVFFATRRLTHLTPHEFFGIAFWLGFTLQLMGAEIWINYTRGRLSAAELNDALPKR